MTPIPARILTHTVTFKVCSSADQWNAPTYTSTVVNHVCVQPVNSVTLSRDDTDRKLSCICFVDAVRSTKYDCETNKITSEDNGHPMLMVFNNHEYEVIRVDTLYDDTGRLHHYEVNCGERSI